jgi:hypothetical protein
MTQFKLKLRAVTAIVATIQAIAFFVFVASISFFAHFHTLPGGRIIIHCHAVPTQDNGKAEQHEHSRIHFIVHHLASHIHVPPTQALQILFILITLALAYLNQAKIATIFNFHTISNRAPPIYCLH